jgi:hypothetical protein
VSAATPSPRIRDLFHIDMPWNPEKAAETVGRTSGQFISRAASFLLLADSRASFEPGFPG